MVKDDTKLALEGAIDQNTLEVLLNEINCQLYMHQREQLEHVRAPEVLLHQQTTIKLLDGLVQLQLLRLLLIVEQPDEHPDHEVEHNIFIEDLFYFGEFGRSSFEK